MTFHVVHQPNSGRARSPFHVIETQSGREVEWVNHFLDREYVRCLANTSLRSYAMDLLHFLRWWTSANQTDALTENAVASVLPDYVRFQAGQQPRPAPATINRRVIVVGCALRHTFPDATCAPASGFSHSYWLRSSLGYGRFLPVRSRFRVKEPKRIPTPLSVDQVAQFWSGFRTARDMAIVGLMLLQGLRSKEVIALDCEDVQLAESRICVHGKGNKVRLLPLASETLPAAGTARRMRSGVIRFAERTYSRHAHHARGIALFIPLSPPHQRRYWRSSTPLPAHLRLRHGSCRNQLARSNEPDGARFHLNDDDLRSDLAARRYRTVCARRSQAVPALPSVQS